MIKLTNKDVLECAEALNLFKFSGPSPLKFMLWKAKTLKVLTEEADSIRKAALFDEEFQKMHEDYRIENTKLRKEFALFDENGNVQEAIDPKTQEKLVVIDPAKKSEFDTKEKELKDSFKDLFDEFDRLNRELEKLLEEETELKNVEKYKFELIEDRELVDTGRVDPVFIHLLD